MRQKTDKPASCSCCIRCFVNVVINSDALTVSTITIALNVMLQIVVNVLTTIMSSGVRSAKKRTVTTVASSYGIQGVLIAWDAGIVIASNNA